MSDLSGRLTRGLTIRYIVILVVLGALSLGAYLVMNLTIAGNESSAALINISGRQRMLSQRVWLLAEHLVHDPAVRKATRIELVRSIDLMETSHEALVGGDPDLNLPGTMSEELRALYFGPDGSVDREVRTYLQHAKAIAAAPDADLYQNNPDMLFLWRMASDTLPRSLDAVVAQYQREGERRIAALHEKHIYVLLLTLFVLLLSAFGVFRPMVSRIRRDIAERERAEEALKQLNAELDRRVEERTVELRNSEASLAKAQHIAHLGNWEWDVDAGALWWSDEVYRIFGLMPQEFDATYEAFLDTVHPDDRDAIDEAFRKSLEENTPYGIDFRILRPDGAVRFVHEEAEVARDHTGKAVLMSGTIQDITERKQVEEELSRNLTNQEIISSIQNLSLEFVSLDEILEQTLALLLLKHEPGFEPAGAIFLVDDDTGELVMRAQTGLHEHLLETCARIPIGYCLCGRAAQSGEVVFTNEIDDRHEVSYPGIKPHGHYCVPIESEGQVLGVLNLYVPEGHQRSEVEDRLITLVAGTLVGIIRRKRAEEALQEREQRVRSIMENVVEGIITIDEKGVIESFNPAAEKVFGYAADEVIGQKVNMLMNPHDREHHDSYIEAYLRTGRGAVIGAGPREVSALRKDGTSFPMELAASEMFLGDKRLFIGVMRDITNRKQTQAQLIQSSKLATLGEMATAMAHELNQPLNVIQMAADNALERIEGGKADAEYLQGKLERISAQIERAAEIIDHMRIFGRRADGEPEDVDLRKVVENALGLMGEQLRLREIGVEMELPEKCRSVSGHAVQLEQVVLNLLTNARDAIMANRTSLGASGKISLSVEDVGSEDKIRLIVKDTGGGIPEEVLPRIFEPFYTTKDIGKGTGLGLSVSYGIIRDMGGTIEAANTGHGAQFTVTLPIAEDRAGGRREIQKPKEPQHVNTAGARDDT